MYNLSDIKELDHCFWAVYDVENAYVSTEQNNSYLHKKDRTRKGFDIVVNGVVADNKSKLKEAKQCLLDHINSTL